MVGILIDDITGDLLIIDGKIAIGNITIQGVEQIIKSTRGEYKEFPLVGGECFKLLHGIYSRFWSNRVKKMCSAMGVPVKRIEYNKHGEIKIEI